MDPIEFNNLASELAAGNTPAKVRTAISRAYYAAFLIGRELLKNKLGIPITETGKGHQDIKIYLNNSGDREFEEVSSKLSTLQRDRLQADYFPENGNVERFTKAKSSVEQAESIIKTMRTDINEPRRSKIIRSIQNYRRIISGFL
jgi:uncharacterized protein (UPF0332 family)